MNKLNHKSEMLDMVGLCSLESRHLHLILLCLPEQEFHLAMKHDAVDWQEAI